MINFLDKKIMLIATTDNMIWQFLIPHITDLIVMGAQVDCFCAKTGFWFDELKDKYHLNMYEINFARSPFRFRNLKAYNDLKKYQRQNHYDLIYCQQPVGGMMGRLIGHKFHIPVIYTAHGFFFFKGNNKIKNFIFKTAEKFLSKYTDVLITMSNEDYSAIKDWKVKYKYLIHGIGLDIDKYDHSPFDKSRLKEELHISTDDKVILTVAEFIKRKNYKAMLKCFSKLHSQHQNTKYILCGQGKLLDKMKHLSHKLNLDDSAIFLGYRKDINRIMQISDVFLLLSKHEGLTMAIMEAMHFGLPVVTSNVRGNKDLIDVRGGFVVDKNDLDSQVQALSTLLNDSSLREQMGNYNRQKIKDYYIDEVRKELKQIYNEVEL